LEEREESSTAREEHEIEREGEMRKSGTDVRSPSVPHFHEKRRELLFSRERSERLDLSHNEYVKNIV